MINAYTWQMNLTIRNLQKHDFGSYVCTSANAIGKEDDRIRINGNCEMNSNSTKPWIYGTCIYGGFYSHFQVPNYMYKLT